VPRGVGLLLPRGKRLIQDLEREPQRGARCLHDGVDVGHGFDDLRKDLANVVGVTLIDAGVGHEEGHLTVGQPQRRPGGAQKRRDVVVHGLGPVGVAQAGHRSPLPSEAGQVAGRRGSVSGWTSGPIRPAARRS
jgi:hypothetical protein